METRPSSLHALRANVALLRLRDKIQGQPPDGWRERYDAVGTEEVLATSPDGEGAGAINVFPGGDTAGA